MRREGQSNLFPAAFLLILTSTFFFPGVSADDAQVMSIFAQSVLPTPAGWTTTASDFCKWKGVSCDSSGQVTSINLSSMSLSGTIPAEINQLSGLKSLSLQHNRFTGQLPPLSGLTSLEQVNLEDNGFDSFPSDFLSGLTSLQFFSIGNNNNLPSWKIPETLADSSSLTSFSASKSSISGEIPDIFGSLPNFLNLRLTYNNLSGPLPASFSNSPIQNLSLNNQNIGLSDTIHVLASMTQLRVAWLHSNNFNGPIPDLSSCKQLTDLLLRDNSLTGVVPDSLTKLPSLQYVALQHNKFQGPMPSFAPGVQVELGTDNNFCLPNPGPCAPEITALLEVSEAMNYPMALAENWVGNNPCQQWKFIVCEHGSVTVINFAKQNWTGTISPAYASLPQLKTLLLNDNKLEGTIPQSLTMLMHLQILDLSNNNLSGKIPTFAPSVKLNVIGNVNIGKDLEEGSPAQGIGGASMVLSTVIIIIVLGLVAIGVVLVFIYTRRRAKQTKQGNVENRRVVSLDMPKDNVQNSTSSTAAGVEKKDYLLHDVGSACIRIEVLDEATNCFSEKNILGRGGFGVVYKGQLHDGTKIAVKRMESSMISNKGLHEFKAEIEVLKKVRHRNLVSLHGFCESGSHRLLVYEFMPYGSLDQRLLHWKDMGVPPLSWNQRVTIALDIARGVEYLHSLAQQSFIHRDLKPSNILLGEDMRAKVSDFGLVRSAPDGNYSVETRLAGTFGYLAPEYATTGRVTTKVDVYAYGVILMEIITGRKALDESLPDEQCHLVAWFRHLLMDKEAIKEAQDPVLRATLDEESFQCLCKLAELAGYCTVREPHQRPDMSHVVNVLSPLLDQWKPVLDNDDSFGTDMQMSLPQVLQKWKADEGLHSSFSSSFFDDRGNSKTTSQ